MKNSETKYYKVVHEDGTNAFYNVDGQKVIDPKDANTENVFVLHDMKYVGLIPQCISD